MKVVLHQKKSWWVPTRRSAKLAVQISDPAAYKAAVKEKVLGLALKEPAAQAMLVDKLVGLEVPADKEEPVEDLVRKLLATVDYYEMVKEGDPETAEPASPERALAAVQEQEALELADWVD